MVQEYKGMQSLIYYISKPLIDTETRYLQLKKSALALVIASRKLKPNFQCHPILIVTTIPLRSILHKPELSGRLGKQAIELSEHDIIYQPRTAIKSQVLADFIVDFSAKVMLEAEKEATQASILTQDLWVLHTDSASNASGFELGLVLEVPTGEIICQFYKVPKYD